MFQDDITESVPKLIFTPRPYQAESINNFYDLSDNGSEGSIIRCFTGGGKTFIGAMACERWIERSSNHFVMVLTHERQLAFQFRDELREALQIPIGLEMGTDGAISHFGAHGTPRIIVASRATLAEKEEQSRLYKFDYSKNWLLIIDECHRYAYKLKSCRHIIDWFEQNTTHRRLGLTATPERGDGVSLGRLFPDVALDYPMFDLTGEKSAINDGWCVPFDQRFISVEGVDFKNINSLAGDFDKDELDEALRRREALLSMCRPLLDLSEDNRTIIFSPGVKTASGVASTLNEFKPNSARSLDGEAHDDIKKATYEDHQTGKFQYLSVCGLCREGYNDPGIKVVAIFRPTKSKPLAEQMKGRGCRPLKGTVDGLDTAQERREAIAASDKPNCMIVDLVGVTGMPPVATTAHLLASGKPDEVIERANENAMENNGPTDMVEELEKAERQINEEAEAAKQKYIEKLRLEKEEAERLAKIKGDVKYSSHKVNNRDIGGAHKKANSASKNKMPFGKFKGQKISDLPSWYLNWTVDKCKSGWLKTAINKEVSKRQGVAAPATDKQLNVLSRFGFSTDGVTQKQAAEIITNEINQGQMALK